MTPLYRVVWSVFPDAVIDGEPNPNINRCAICSCVCSGEACKWPCTELYAGYVAAMRSGG